MTGGGNVGYFIHDRTIVNMDGLINSNDYFHALQNKEAPTYLYQHGVQIIFANPQLLNFPHITVNSRPIWKDYNSIWRQRIVISFGRTKILGCLASCLFLINQH